MIKAASLGLGSCYVAVFDDNFYKKILPRSIVRKAELAERDCKFSKDQFIVSWIVVILVVMLSVPVVVNLLSDNQAMNTSFNKLHIVNTYGAFGSVGRNRYELIVEGTDESKITAHTKWKEYEFKAKPTSLDRSFDLRIDSDSFFRVSIFFLIESLLMASIIQYFIQKAELFRPHKVLHLITKLKMGVSSYGNTIFSAQPHLLK